MKKSAVWLAVAALALSGLFATSASSAQPNTPNAPKEIGRIYFDLDQPTLSASEKSQLDALLPALKNAAKIRVDGYAGSKGTPKKKIDRLANARATQVAEYLKSKGITATIIKSNRGYATDTKDRKKMRRVVITVLASKSAGITYSFSISTSWAAAYTVSEVGFGTNPAKATASTPGAAWDCIDGQCSLSKSLRAPAGQTSAWVKVTCKSDGASASDVCTWLYLPSDSKWTLVNGPNATTKYYKTTSISGTDVEPLMVEGLS